MKIVLIIIALIAFAFIITLFVLGFSSRSGKAPGLIDGRLVKCPDKPNCICSEQKSDTDHYIEPIIIPENLKLDTLPLLKETIREMGGSIVVEDDNYLATTFSVAVFGFVDDLEIRVDAIHQVIHIRSASRVGRGDLGVNRKRAERLKKLYYQKVLEADN